MKADLAALRDLQLRLLKRSAFGGMSKAEIKEYEERKTRINEIAEALLHATEP